MKFQVCCIGQFWEVGFYKDSKNQKWIGLNSHRNKAEADAECSRLIGGNTPPVRHDQSYEAEE